MIKKSVGTTGMPKVLFKSAGIGYVSIPSNFDRKKFVRSCYDTSTVMIRNENGDNWGNVHVDRNVMQELEFPADSKSRGSALLWVMLPKHNMPVVVALLELKDKRGQVTEERAFNLSRSAPKGKVSIDGKADKSELTISVLSQTNGVGSMKINVLNPDETASIDVFVKGMATIFATKKIRLVSNKDLSFEVVDKNNNSKGLFSYSVGVGFTMQDEKGNKIVTNANGVIQTPAAGKKIFVGGNTTSEAAVKGTTLNTNITNLITQIQNLVTVLQTIGAADSTLATSLGLTYGATLAAAMPAITTGLSSVSGALQSHLAQKSEVE